MLSIAANANRDAPSIEISLPPLLLISQKYRRQLGAEGAYFSTIFLYAGKLSTARCAGFLRLCISCLNKSS